MNSPEPLKLTHGFKAKAGHCLINLGYTIRPSGIVTLFAFIKFGTMDYEPWREFQCGAESAVSQAMAMARDAIAFLGTQGPAREVEDLDFDDFIQHLSANINKELH